MFDFLKKNTVSNKIETKSVQNQLTGSVTSIYSDFPSSLRMPSDSVEILSYNKGYANSCTRIVAQAIADLPYYLYRISNAKSGKYIGKSLKVLDKTFLNRVGKAFSTGDYSLEKVFEHPFLNLIEDNMQRSITEFFFLVSQYLLTIGNCYIAIIRDARGNLINLDILMSEYISVRYDKDYKIVSYVYQPLLGGCKAVTYMPEEILHLKRTVAGSMIVGRGILEEALMSVSLGEETKKYLNCLLNNNMTPKNLIVVKNSIKDEEQATRIKDKMVEQFSGYNRGKSIVTFGDVAVEEISQNLGDNKVIETNEFVKKEICSLFGVPIDLLDSSNSNRATSMTAMANFQKNTVFPMANAIVDQINRQLVSKEYDTSFMLQYDTAESLEADPVEQADLYKKYIDMGIMTPEEVKAKLGL